MYWGDKNVQTYEKFAHSGEVIGFSGFRGEDLTRRGEFRGLRPPSEICFGTSEI